MIKFIIVPKLGKKHLPNTISKAHQLGTWVVFTIGMANMAAQFYIHNYNFVSCNYFKIL